MYILYYEVKMQLVKQKNFGARLLFPTLLLMLCGHRWCIFKLLGNITQGEGEVEVF